jgi:hypothetical protein
MIRTALYRASLAIHALVHLQRFRALGGPGSGNFGHGGRKGEVGGSSSEGSAKDALSRLPESRKLIGHVENPLVRAHDLAYTLRGRMALADVSKKTGGGQTIHMDRHIVDISKIDSAQPFVEKQQVEHYIDHPPAEHESHGWAIRGDGDRVWLIDGNHRVSAAQLNGEKHVRLDIVR